MRRYFLVLSVVLMIAASCVTDSIVLPKPVGSLALDPANNGVVELDCLTRFNACVNMDGYRELSRAFYNDISGAPAPEEADKTTITVVSTDTGTDATAITDALDLYFPSVAGVTADPASFVSVGVESPGTGTSPTPLSWAVPDVMLVTSSLTIIQWGNLMTAFENDAFILTTSLDNIIADVNTNLRLVQVAFSDDPSAPSCTQGFASTCITVNNTIGGALSGSGEVSTGTVEPANNLYALGSGFAMLKTLFVELTHENMFGIIENDACATNGYFTFACVVDGTNISVTVGGASATEGVGSLELDPASSADAVYSGLDCLTRFNACVNMAGYKELSGAFYNYISGLSSNLPSGSSATTITVVSTATEDAATDITNALNAYFPTVTPSGAGAAAIDPASFVSVAIESPGTGTSPTGPTWAVPDVMLTVFNWHPNQWAALEVLASAGAFVLATNSYLIDIQLSGSFYVVQVAFSDVSSPPSCSQRYAAACITVNNTIGGVLSGDGTSTGAVSATNNLYALGSGFAMLKTLFPDDLDHAGMFAIIENDDCLEGGYFTFACVVDGANISVAVDPRTEKQSVGSLAVDPANYAGAVYGELDCLTRFNACVNMAGYKELSGAFYNYISGAPAPAVLDRTTITVVSTATGDAATDITNALNAYFPTVTPSGAGAAAINPASFLSVAIESPGISDTVITDLTWDVPDVMLVSSPTFIGWGSLERTFEHDAFILATDVSAFSPGGSAVNPNMRLVYVVFSDDPSAPSCTQGEAHACITVNNTIGGVLSGDGTSTGAASATNNLYALGSGFAMLKTLFPDDLDRAGMLAIIENDACETGGYFTFACVVDGTTNIFVTEALSTETNPVGSLAVVPADTAVVYGGLDCLTRFNACVDMDGYQALSRAFYLYASDSTNAPAAAEDRTTISVVLTATGGAATDIINALNAYFPTVTPSGTGASAIDPGSFVTTGTLAVTGTIAGTIPDVLLVDNTLNPTEWGYLFALTNAFILATHVADLPTDVSAIYVVEVQPVAANGACENTTATADSCITVSNTIGGALSVDGTVSTGANVSLSNNLYLLGSGFAMLKTLFADLTSENMFTIATNPSCSVTNNYFTFACVVESTNISVTEGTVTGTTQEVGTLALPSWDYGSCLTRFGACVNMAGYQKISGAFYNSINGATAPSQADRTTITVVSAATGTAATGITNALNAYFPSVTPSGEGATAINPASFVNVRVESPTNAPSGSLLWDVPDVMLVASSLTLAQWGNLQDKFENDAFILATDVSTLDAAVKPNLRLVYVTFSDGLSPSSCSNGHASACITVNNTIGSTLSTDGTATGAASDTNNLYALGSGFVMLKTLFADLTKANMFGIIENDACVNTAGYFTFACVVDGTDISVEVGGAVFTRSIGTLALSWNGANTGSCLTRFGACDNLGGYRAISGAFYNYISGLSSTLPSGSSATTISVATTSNDTTTNSATVAALDAYFPIVTPSGTSAIAIDPASFVTTGIYNSGIIPDVLLVDVVADWSTLSIDAINGAFVLVTDVTNLRAYPNNPVLYVVQVTEGTACPATFLADACITVNNTIGSPLSSSGTVPTEGATSSQNLYALGSGFAMLKTLFVELTHKDMFAIITNPLCAVANSYFTFACVGDGTNISVTVGPITEMKNVGNLTLPSWDASCLTRFNACVNMAGYQDLSRAFYLYASNQTDVPAEAGRTTISVATTSTDTTINDATVAALDLYFPSVTLSGGTAVDPASFVTTGTYDALVSTETMPDVLLVDTALDRTQWDNLVTASGSSGSFILATNVSGLTADINDTADGKFYVVRVNEGTTTNCDGIADNCIAVNDTIGGTLNASNGNVSDDPVSATNNLYLLGSGFAMLKTLFTGLTSANMFAIIGNPSCAVTNSYFTFACVVDGTNISVTVDATATKNVGNLMIPSSWERLSCLNRSNACVDLGGLGGYQEISGAFYNYISSLDSILPEDSSATTISVATTASGTAEEITTANDITVAALNAYFPTVTPSGDNASAINPANFVTTGTLDVTSAITETIPDVLLVDAVLDVNQWGRLSASADAFVLATNVNDLGANGADFYVVEVQPLAIAGACVSVAANADACITVNNTIGRTLNSSDAVAGQNLYALGSAFAMLKTLFPDDLDHAGMFAIVTNTDCQVSQSNDIFSLSCVVNFSRDKVYNEPQEAETSEASPPSLPSFDVLRAAQSAAREHMYSDVMSHSAPKILWQDGSVSVLSEQVQGSVVGSRMRAQYHTQGASVGALISAYRYDDRLSALSRSSVDARMALGVAGDLSLASAMRFYAQVFGVYETGLLSSALFGEHRVDRVMGVGVVGVSYQMSSGSAVALEGRCSVGHLVSVAGAVATASSFCDTALRIQVTF